MASVKTWTYNLVNGSITITPAFSLTRLQVLLVSGTGTATGSLNTGGIPSQPLALTIGVPLGFSNGPSSVLVLEDITITTTGTIQIIGR